MRLVRLDLESVDSFDEKKTLVNKRIRKMCDRRGVAILVNNGRTSEHT